MEECVSCCGESGCDCGGLRAGCYGVMFLITARIFQRKHALFALLRSYVGTCGDLDYTVWLEKAGGHSCHRYTMYHYSGWVRLSVAQGDKQ